MNTVPSEDIFLHPNDHKRKSDWLTILRCMDDYLPYDNINTSLDLGGGRGDISYHLLKKNNLGQATCIDVDESLLKEAKGRHPNLDTLAFDINKPLPFADNSMDLVSCLGTLHYYYIKDPKPVFSEIVRVSKKYVMVDFLYKYRLWYFLLKLRYPNYNPKRWLASEIKELLNQHNLKIIGAVGTRNPFGKLFPSFGRTTIFILEKHGK
jgi:ubiquinone/menaquinone biosynthesis C-methylase UbiE